MKNRNERLHKLVGIPVLIDPQEGGKDNHASPFEYPKPDFLSVSVPNGIEGTLKAIG